MLASWSVFNPCYLKTGLTLSRTTSLYSMFLSSLSVSLLNL